ncbi:MAG: hypothetical protein PHH27_02610 [Candidatus Colwellbacteria bacterium]|nr:hypothetical protein [Candidatus Colwellbacteria bacterium]
MNISKNKKIIFLCLSFLFLTLLIPRAEASTLAEQLSGRIVLQVESKGEAYYINPLDKKGYYLGRPDDAFAVMRYFGLGVSNNDLDNFFKKGVRADLSGRIFLKVQDKGQAYYVNPVNRQLYYLGRPSDAFNIMRQLGLGISNSNLEKISLQILIPNNSIPNPGEIVNPGEKAVRFTFKYKNKNYYLDQVYSDSLYNDYKNTNKFLQYPASNPPQNLRESYYNIFLTLKSGDDSIDKLVNDLRSLAIKEGFSENELVEFSMALVQYIPYDNSKNLSSPQNFPYETLYKNSGVCSDKSFLALLILRKLGYGAVIFDYPDDNHSAVAVACSGQSSYNSGYCFIETTNYFPVGVFPSSLSSGQAESGQVNWAQIFSGDSLGRVETYQQTNGLVFSGMNNIVSQVDAISKMNTSIKQKKSEIDNLLLQLNTMQNELNQLLVKIEEYDQNNDVYNYNLSVNEYNSKAGIYNTVLENHSLKVQIYNNDIALFNNMVKSFYQN